MKLLEGKGFGSGNEGSRFGLWLSFAFSILALGAQGFGFDVECSELMTCSSKCKCSASRLDLKDARDADSTDSNILSCKEGGVGGLNRPNVRNRNIGCYNRGAEVCFVHRIFVACVQTHACMFMYGM